MMSVLNLKTAGDRCSPSNIGPHETNFKVGDMILLKNHNPTTAFDIKYRTSYQISK